MDQLVHRRFDFPQVSVVCLHAVCGIVDAEIVVPSAEKPELWTVRSTVRKACMDQLLVHTPSTGWRKDVVSQCVDILDIFNSFVCWFSAWSLGSVVQVRTLLYSPCFIYCQELSLPSLFIHLPPPVLFKSETLNICMSRMLVTNWLLFCPDAYDHVQLNGP